MLKRLRLDIILLALAMPFTAMAQREANIGVFGGTSYYMGDINPNRHFYRPAPSFGFLYRYNFNARYALRLNIFEVNLSGNDLDFPGRLNPDRPVSPANFSTSLLDMSVQGEFNFLSFTPNFGKWNYTPYLFAGAGGALVISSNTNATNTIAIPFGIGAKINITSRLSAGAEWGFRKTFSDRIDGVQNPSGKQTWIHNNDWYSIMGIFITYKFFNFAADCPAYR
jgi:opacity protein-like surface antigen